MTCFTVLRVLSNDARTCRNPDSVGCPGIRLFNLGRCRYFRHAYRGIVCLTLLVVGLVGPAWSITVIPPGGTPVPTGTPDPFATPTPIVSVSPSPSPSVAAIASSMPATVDVHVPLVEDPKWVPVWVELTGLLMRGALLIIIGFVFVGVFR